MPSFVGFGSNSPGLTVLGTNINLEGIAAITSLNYAFSVPRDGTITAIEAFFSVTGASLSLTDYDVHAVLYRSPAPATNIFSELTGTDVTLTPPISGLSISLGTITRGSASVSVPVNAGDRLLLVFYLEGDALSIASTLIGYASAGITID